MRTVAAGAGIGLFALFVAALSGLPDFGAKNASSLVDWYFHIAARQSVSLRSAGTEVPPLDDPSMILRGAGHYELVCATCHGSPTRPADAIAASMSPRPPALVDQMGNWRAPERVFWTVKHGISRSAMPGWPTDLRDDEVWSMVAFLEQLPRIDATDYEALIGPTGVSPCARCHGEDGRGRNGAFPRLDIQSPAYLKAALQAFRQCTRASGTMIAAANGLSDDQISQLATEFGRGLPVEPSGSELGATIAQHGIPERNIPACDACHGGAGRADYPRLAGQSSDYILQQLQLFSEHGAARGGRYAGIMAVVARELTAEDMRAVADWYGQ